MNIGAAETARRAAALAPAVASFGNAIDMFVLPPFASLHAARQAFSSSTVAISGQNMHWEASGAWTGEISAPMLVEAGCRCVELAHSERLEYFGETYEQVRRKVDAAMASGLTPILYLGETDDDRRRGVADRVLVDQMSLALADQAAEQVPNIVLAYEPRWAIGATAAASPDYAAARHRSLRSAIDARFGSDAAARTRINYGGSVMSGNDVALMEHGDIDGLFVGRAALSPNGLAEIAATAARATSRRNSR
ncbi:MAG: triosephosphate isomerase [Pseudomonadota bacterium]|nr:triosephosphate isomerase [Pseudomonadota bacterium]